MREKGSTDDGQRAVPSRCGDVLLGTLQGLGFDRVIRHLALLRAWERSVAQRVRERATVEGFRDGRLYLRVEDPIWLHELHMLRHTLKTILNEDVGESVVGDIVLRIGPTPVRVRSQAPHSLPVKASALSPAAEGRVQELLFPVKDLPCRDALERLLHRWTMRSI